MLRDDAWVAPNGEAQRFPSNLRTRSATGGLFETIIRDLTLDRSNVRLLDGHEVVGLLGDSATVRGVVLRRRPARSGPAVRSERAADDGRAHGANRLEPDAWVVVDAVIR